MNIREFAFELQNIYDDMGKEFSTYQRESGLLCLEGCGKCCKNPDIEASVLEMIPLALRMFDENRTDEWLEKLENPSQEHCLLYELSSPDGSNGSCKAYKERPSLCRMFGVAGFFNKRGEVTLSVCKYIREARPELAKTRESETDPENTPMLSNWSYRMAELDPALIQNKLPINQAFKKALEKVALYALYQDQT